MILPETPKKGAMGLADTIRRKIGQHPFESGNPGRNGTITVSMGVASYPDDGVDVAGLILSADRSLYEAKKQGRNRACSNPLPPG